MSSEPIPIPNHEPDVGDLSERELEVLQLVAEGASNKQIAGQLSISQNTVKVHLRNIFAKTGANSRTEAAMYAVRIGLVQPGTDSRLDGSQPGGWDVARRSMAERGRSGPEGALIGWILAHRQLVTLLMVALIALSLVGLYALFTRPQQTVTPTGVQQTQPTPLPRWTELEAMPTARQGLAVVAFENQIVAIGGQTSADVTGIVERYDPAQDQWIAAAEKPTPVRDIHGAVIGGRVFVPGGQGPGGSLSDVLEIYDPRLDRWEQGAPLPIPLSGYGLVAFEGQLFLFGGWDGARYLDTVLVYDPDQDTWGELPPMPTARGYAEAAVAAGAIYVIGGKNLGGSVPVNEEFSPSRLNGEGNPWQEKAPLPEGRYGMGVVSISDILHVIGGEDGGQLLTPLKYFPQSDLWEAFEVPDQQPWSFLGAAGLETRIYAIGGVQGGAPSAQNRAYKALYTISLPVFRE